MNMGTDSGSLQTASPGDIDDLLDFADEPEQHDDHDGHVWQVLVVDDDPEVHHATRLALSSLSVFDRRLQLLYAHSALEARHVIESEPDIAVILLDVVMETADAGLRLVKVIREELGRQAVRIILRTGQPGYAPEVEVIRDYDINDYRNKSDLTLTHLFTALTSAIRSSQQIRSLEANRQGLAMIIRSSATLLATHGLQEFAEGVLIQISALLGVPPEGILCAEALYLEDSDSHDSATILAAAGMFRSWQSQPFSHLPEGEARQTIQRAFNERQTIYTRNGAALFINGRSSRHIVAYIQSKKSFDALAAELLEVFCANLSIGFENVALFTRMHDAAYVDHLTTLPNRQQMLLDIEQGLQSDRDNWLVLLDIDRFSEINDSFGFAAGDALLQAVARRLQAVFGPEIAVAHITADTFALFGERSRLTTTAVFDSLAAPFLIGNESVRISACLGCSRITHGADGPAILRAASIALKRAKQQAAATVCEFAPEMEKPRTNG